MATQLSVAQGNLPIYYTTILPSVAPAKPSTGWTLFSDSNDGNKLKALAYTGTTIVLGTP